MKKWKKKKMEYAHSREGDTVKVEIKDSTRRTIYRTKFNIRDRKAIIAFLQVLENYSSFSITSLVKEKLKMDEIGWW